MSTYEVGIRVGAILKANPDTVWLLGYGIYDGDLEAPEGTIFSGMPNPHITLDNGHEAWGYQCWWGPEDKIKEMVGDRQVIETTIEEVNAPSSS